MDILKASTDWAKAELFSTPFFVIFGVLFLVGSLGFWQLGKSELARAYIIPMLVAGTLLTIIGLGLFFTNKARIGQFEKAHSENPAAFVASELDRADRTMKEYQNIVFTGIPIIIVACAIGLRIFSSPTWRASLITAIAMLVVILLIDGTAHVRIQNYEQQLKSYQGDT